MASLTRLLLAWVASAALFASSDATQGFEESTATQYAYLAGVSYCPNTQEVEQWTCSFCIAPMDAGSVTVFDSKKTNSHGYKNRRTRCHTCSCLPSVFKSYHSTTRKPFSRNASTCSRL